MKFSIKPSSTARELAGKMSLKEALDQVSAPLLNFSPEVGYGAAHLSSASAEFMSARANQLKQLSAIPPFFTADLECGPGKIIKGATRFPDMMALGSADSEELSYEVGKAAALEGGAVGLNWSLSPCVDIATNPDSPVVSTRSAGRTPERVIKTARGYMKGLQDHGFLATLKHFPGDGYSTLDQHLTTVVNPLSMEEWHQGPGRVYRELINAGARSIMIGHISLPSFDELDPEMGLCPPATISKRLITDLLKNQLGFEGLIISDAMGMGGVAGFCNIYEAYARFLEAGGDCVLFPQVADGRYTRQMEDCIRRGILKEATVYDRATRMIAVKEEMGLLASTPVVKNTVDHQAHEDLVRKVVNASVALVRDRRNTIPFKLTEQSRILHVILAQNYSAEKSVYDALTNALRSSCESVDEVVDPGPHSLQSRVTDRKYDAVICSIGAVHSWGVNVARLHGPICRNMMDGWMRMGTPAIFVSHFHPFVHLEYEASMDCVINTFRSLDLTGERVVQGITGETPFTGGF